jgi:hypothetical protein
MSTPQDDDILFRAGATTLLKYGVPWRRRRWDALEAEGAAFTRADAATCATYFGPDGLLRVALANRLRLTYGDPAASLGAALLLEGARTNVCLRNRDLANAAWTKVSCSAVKDQTGIDGVASSASRITATAGNGTCLQAITLGSSARAQSAYIKRLVGSGTIQMTMDNGGTWTTVTVTSAWTRVTIPTQTIANPTVGFQIVTNTDSVAIDFVQNENGAYASSPIETVAALVTRAADVLPFPIGFSQPGVGEELSLYARFDALWPRTGSDGLAPGVFTLGGTGAFAVDGLTIWDAHRATGSANLNVRLAPNSASGVSVSPALPGAGAMELLTQLRANGALHELHADLNGSAGTSGTIALAGFPWRTQILHPGTRGNSTDPGFILLYDLIVARGRFTVADFQGVV